MATLSPLISRSMRRLVMPLRMFARGGLAYAIYLAAAAAAVGFALIWTRDLIMTALADSDLLRKSSTTFSFLQFLAYWAPWIVLLPVCLSVAASATALIWRGETFTLSVALQGALKPILLTPRALVLALRAALSKLIPGLAMILIYYGFVRHLAHNSAYFVYLIASLGVLLLSVYRALPILASPLITLLVGERPERAVYWSLAVLQRKRKEFAFWLTSAALVYVWLIIPLEGHISRAVAPHDWWAIWSVRLVFYWYFFTQLCIDTLDALLRFERERAQNQNQPQPPTQQTPPATAQIKESLSQRMPDLKAEQAIPADFRLTGVWMSEDKDK